MSNIRVLAGPAYHVVSGPLLTFEVGNPPEVVSVSGTNYTQLAEGEYVAVAVEGKSFAGRGAAVLAYRWMGQRGEAHGVGYVWIVVCLLLCVSSLVLCGLILMRHPNLFVAGSALLVSAFFGAIGINRLLSVRAAVAALAGRTPL